MNRRLATIISLIGTVINGLFFVISGYNEAIGLVFLVWAVVTLMFNNKSWAVEFRKNMGISILGGIVVSALRDLAVGEFFTLINWYFIGVAAAVILLIPGASRGEEL